jgi:hypothetical protein
LFHGAPGWSAERLPARPLGDGTYEVCAVPTLVYDVALGDVVRCRSNPSEDALDVEAVVRRGGHRTLRIEAAAEEKLEEAARIAGESGAGPGEWAPDGSASFDLPAAVDAEQLRRRLGALPGLTVHLS